MLNELCGLSTPGHDGYLTRQSNFKQVEKQYKKTLRHIHPDKHMGENTTTQTRATEIFKIVNQRFMEYKKQCETRGEI